MATYTTITAYCDYCGSKMEPIQHSGKRATRLACPMCGTQLPIDGKEIVIRLSGAIDAQNEDNLRQKLAEAQERANRAYAAGFVAGQAAVRGIHQRRKSASE